MRIEKIRLGDLLVRQGILSDEQLQIALAEQKRSGQKLGRIVIELGFANEDAVSRALAKQQNIPFVDLKRVLPDPNLVRLLPEALVRRFRVAVLEELAKGKLRIGFVDPTDLHAYDEISRVLRRQIDLVVIAETQLQSLIDRVYKRTEEITGLAKALTEELGDIAVELGDMQAGSVGAEDAPVVKLLQTVFDEALRMHASDIHLEPQEMGLRIRFRVDGVLHVQTETDSKVAVSLTLRLKLVAGLNISEKRLPQDGRFAVKVRNHVVDVRISTLPTQYGESVVMRLLSRNSNLLGLDHLGLPDRILQRLRHSLRRPNGMVLVTGPTGSGKTTSVYAALSEMNSTEKKIITVEDPVEYRLPGISQVQVHDKIDRTFDRVLRSALRQDPDVVVIGEIRDQITAEIGMRAAMTGHMVLSTLHTNDVVSTPIRLLDMGVPRYMVAFSLRMVLAQRLVRVVCESCAEPYTPTPNEKAWLRNELGDTVDRWHYKQGRGCTHCNETGYQGRAGVYEMLEMTDELIEAMNSENTKHFIVAAKKQMAGQTLRRDAVRLAVRGRTTIEEAMRISNQFED